jgi:hypothetical protein
VLKALSFMFEYIGKEVQVQSWLICHVLLLTNFIALIQCRRDG